MSSFTIHNHPEWTHCNNNNNNNRRRSKSRRRSFCRSTTTTHNSRSTGVMGSIQHHVVTLILLLLSTNIVRDHQNVGIVVVEARVIGTTGTLTTFVPPAAYTYRSQILYIDDDSESLRLPPYHRLSANLIRPPRPPPSQEDQGESTSSLYDDRLCNDIVAPNATATTPVDPTVYQFAPVALLVQLGGCSLQRKLEVALQLRSQHIANDTLWSIMFYNDPDPTIMNNPQITNSADILNAAEHSTIQSLYDELGSINTTELPYVDQMIYASISYRTGRMIMNQMGRTAERLSDNIKTPPVVGPVLYTEGNDVWRFPVSLERGSNPYRPGRDISNSSGSNTNDEPTLGQLTFIWFRFILFGLLACFPCLRFIRLWFAAGGRIRFRRNENNRIVGLYLQAPDDEDWLAPSRQVTRRRRRHGDGRGDGDDRQLLTKEQVMELLPEISYVRPASAKYAEDEPDYYFATGEEGDNEDGMTGKDTTNQMEEDSEVGETSGVSQVVTTVASTVPTGAAVEESSHSLPESTIESIPIQMETTVETNNDDQVDVEQPATVQQQTNTDNNDPTAAQDILEAESNVDAMAVTTLDGDNTDSADSDQVRNQSSTKPLSSEGDGDDSSTQKKVFTATTSTTCSICIEEFEEGELVRLLPQCGHAYHTECILPWLTERQNHCPLCKVPVLSSLSSPSQSQDEDNVEEQVEEGTAEPQTEHDDEDDDGHEHGNGQIGTINDVNGNISEQDTRNGDTIGTSRNNHDGDEENQLNQR